MAGVSLQVAKVMLAATEATDVDVGMAEQD